MKNEKQEMKPLIVRLEEFLFRSHEYRMNIISNHLQRREKGEGEWEIVQMSDVEVELYKSGFKGFKDPLKALFGSKVIERYDPFVSYFENLPKWDNSQPDYINHLASYVETEDHEWFELMFKKWLVRCIGQAVGLIPFNKQCLTFVGKQNDGKTTFLDYLIPEPLKNYVKKSFDFGSKEGKFSLVQNFFVNLDELAAFDKKELNNEFKSILSESAVKFRPLFQNVEVSFQRRASFVASTNQFEFLTDETGNVRWLPFVIKKINHDNGGANGYTTVLIDLVWSQAYALLQDSSFRSEMIPSEIVHQEKLNRQFLKTTTEMEIIDKYFSVGDRHDPHVKFYTASDIEEELKGYISIRLYRNQIGKALQILGYKQESYYDTSKGYSYKGYFLKRK